MNNGSFGSLITRILTGVLLLIVCLVTQADVVKPALIEISVHKSGLVELEIRASLEAIITGINARYKNTKDAPNAGAYDVLRKKDSSGLLEEFNDFKDQYLSAIVLNSHSKSHYVSIDLTVSKVDIPPAGYTKVPRISTVIMRGNLPKDSVSLSLYYPAKYSDYALRVRQVDEQAQLWHWSEWAWVKQDRFSAIFSLGEIYAKNSKIQIAKTYTQLGFLHILPRGLDHILFILGLFLFSRSLRPLLWQVTMFTLAHMITLGLAASGIVELPARVVEPLIALSIAYVGIENVFSSRLRKHRLILVFAFGLLHGLGFAKVLLDFELPPDAFYTALLSFNVGVELGQLAIIFGAWLMLRWWMKSDNYRKVVVIPGSLLIGVTGLVWMIERLNGWPT